MPAFADADAMTDTPSSLLIDPLRLPALLGIARGRFDVDALLACESTSTLLLKRAAQGAPSGSVIVADRQSAGRGSRGRQWLATPEASLTFSVLWRFDGGLERLAGLSLAVGSAVVQALEACGATGLSLKWPNDILHDNAKLGGILVELQNEPDRALAVIGIGLNLTLPDSLVERDDFALPAAALDGVLLPLPERHRLFAQLLLELAQVLDRFADGGFAVLRDQWQARHAWQDRPVRLLRDGRVEMEGVCRGADLDGALLVQTGTGIKRCLSGDLSLRAL
ncbi:biotin--[acetyl-CoA-carboxylase] ligase [Propionivibrio sp.]|uniref:biotin--[acetyl-CoA-carboxylase] ligase n=1 Tax=Propionivibrio sp. TaxID=2212460 RepID=UPI00263159DC|nr:biotin--[acetyl-CoA-carboxylase] ligase [Propionivibrio sp.]